MWVTCYRECQGMSKHEKSRDYVVVVRQCGHSRSGLSIKRTKNFITWHLTSVFFKWNNHCRPFGSSVNGKLRIPLALDAWMMCRKPGGGDGREEWLPAQPGSSRQIRAPWQSRCCAGIWWAKAERAKSTSTSAFIWVNLGTPLLSTMRHLGFSFLPRQRGKGCST